MGKKRLKVKKSGILKGTYCLIINNESDKKIKIGKLNDIEFNKGFYVYVGSGRNSLIPRLKRHLSDDKKLHWHVDYFLKEKTVDIVEIIFTISNEKLECALSSLISESNKTIDNFGCSDCMCSSHLIYFKSKEEAIINVKNAYDNINKEYKNLNYFHKLINS
ncbi:GIY-YIG nuclease family protein [Methanobrevibacter filiformis]|uniref:GIY-YIG domain-containing protein n=1 Tax=Methanobrevibacter filiformis TaxID=55758 RepID=A0A166CYM7_9EURY|nr:GIY-YIG nuclease family protein [Methanobrevibacter filiformis]KZX17597.1 hypothetical protein MBFIL_00830 [Methanobrevibacter filiformis]